MRPALLYHDTFYSDLSVWASQWSYGGPGSARFTAETLLHVEGTTLESLVSPPDWQRIPRVNTTRSPSLAPYSC